MYKYGVYLILGCWLLNIQALLVPTAFAPLACDNIPCKPNACDVRGDERVLDSTIPSKSIADK